MLKLLRQLDRLIPSTRRLFTAFGFALSFIIFTVPKLPLNTDNGRVVSTIIAVVFGLLVEWWTWRPIKRQREALDNAVRRLKALLEARERSALQLPSDPNWQLARKCVTDGEEALKYGP